MKTITILGQKYKIVDKSMEDQLGECDPDKRVLSIDPKQNDDQYASSTLHEIIHASLYISGLSFILEEKLEEAVVRAVEHALHPLVTFRKPIK